MSNSAIDVAEAFARVIAEERSEELVGDDGEPMAISVPLNRGGSAELAFNGEAKGWVLSVAKSLGHWGEVELADHFESLVTRTNMTRFGRPAVASLNGADEATVSTFLAGTPTAIEVETLLVDLAELLDPNSDGSFPSDADLANGPWVRI